MADGTLRSAKDGLCALCYAKATDKCAKCKARWYCSSFCQQKDWKLGHKGNCGLEDLPQPTVPEPPHRLLPESVSRPVISDSAWRRLQELDAGPRKGPARGLRNLGNSCYMNAVLQGLFHGSPLLLNACREHWASCGGPSAAGCSAGGPRAAINGSTGCFRCDLQAAAQMCLDPLGHEGSADSGEEAEFVAGDRVLLQGLSQEELNGQEGLVVSPPSYTAATSSSSGELRYGVRLAGLPQTKAIKPQNLALRCRAAVGPSDVVRWLPRLHSDFTFGMQEDAHEFLRSVLRLVEDEELKDHAEVLRRGVAEDSGGATSSSAPAPNADLTASPSRIFGGLLASQCTCTNRSCCASSFSFETFQDLSLDVTEVTDSIEDALRLYTAPERLDKKNGWRCEVCAEVVRARKQITIYTAPSFLVLHLKRFRYETHGKVTRPVAFQSKLNLRPFLCSGSPEAAGSLMYDLRVVVVHLDKAGFSHFGHYVAYVRCLPSEGAGGAARWWLLDDSQAVEVTEAEVLSQQAYLLLYSRASASAPDAPPTLQRGRSGAEAGAAGGESLPSKCRGRGGALCSFFAGHDGLCTKCYQEEFGREPPAAPAPTPSPAPQPAPAAPKAKASPAPAAKAAAAKAAPAAGAAGSGRVKKVGANEQCPCGSGKKYKKCHGAA